MATNVVDMAVAVDVDVAERCAIDLNGVIHPTEGAAAVAATESDMSWISDGCANGTTPPHSIRISKPYLKQIRGTRSNFH